MYCLWMQFCRQPVNLFDETNPDWAPSVSLGYGTDSRRLKRLACKRQADVGEAAVASEASSGSSPDSPQPSQAEEVSADEYNTTPMQRARRRLDFDVGGYGDATSPTLPPAADYHQQQQRLDEWLAASRRQNLACRLRHFRNAQSSIKRWLPGSGDRCGGRKRRFKEAFVVEHTDDPCCPSGDHRLPTVAGFLPSHYDQGLGGPTIANVPPWRHLPWYCNVICKKAGCDISEAQSFIKRWLSRSGDHCGDRKRRFKEAFVVEQPDDPCCPSRDHRLPTVAGFLPSHCNQGLGGPTTANMPSWLHLPWVCILADNDLFGYFANM
ncbi:hypothetical protein MTO96_040313 [Rhipicephalus appendiculatus]